MKRYCGKCRKMHDENELCPNISVQLQEHPEWLSEAANFAMIAGEYELVSSNALDAVAQKINTIAGINLHFEGTHQLARDIQVFKRLNEEAFVKAGYFASPDAAKAYLQNATPSQLKGLIAKINGSGQEVDWLREQAGKLSSLTQKSELLNKNAVGVDGVVYNRFTGEQITQVTIKATQTQSGLNTNVQQIVEAIKLDRLASNETVYGIDGTREALMKKLAKEIKHAKLCGDEQLAQKLSQAKDGIKVVESGTPEKVIQNKERILKKISSGQATTNVTTQQIAAKAAQGAVIGAAIELTVSSITSYVCYKNGEITKDDAYREVGESVTKGALTGGLVSGVSLFLPTDALGFVGGFAIGVYIGTVAKNVLDELFGKGFYAEVLHASGYIYGTSIALTDALKKVSANHRVVIQNLAETTTNQAQAEADIDALMNELGG